MDNRFVHLVIQKQPGNGVREKEAEVVMERRLGSQPRKSVLKANK